MGNCESVQASIPDSWISSLGQVAELDGLSVRALFQTGRTFRDMALQLRKPQLNYSCQERPAKVAALLRALEHSDKVEIIYKTQHSFGQILTPEQLDGILTTSAAGHLHHELLRATGVQLCFGWADFHCLPALPAERIAAIHLKELLFTFPEVVTKESLDAVHQACLKISSMNPQSVQGLSIHCRWWSGSSTLLPFNDMTAVVSMLGDWLGSGNVEMKVRVMHLGKVPASTPTVDQILRLLDVINSMWLPEGNCALAAPEAAFQDDAMVALIQGLPWQVSTLMLTPRIVREATNADLFLFSYDSLCRGIQAATMPLKIEFEWFARRPWSEEEKAGLKSANKLVSVGLQEDDFVVL